MVDREARTIAPYGSWRSPVTARLIAEGGVGIAWPQSVGESLYWVELRPTEDGRYVVVRRDAAGAVADVTFGACPTEAGAHDVTATVRNSSSAPRDYVITVSWVNATFDVLARAVAVVEQAPPGEEVPAELGATVPDGAADCTFHVTAGTLD